MSTMPTIEELTTLEALAKRLFAGKAFPDTVRSVDTAFAILLKGWELGMPAMAAASGIAIVSGKVSLGADATAGACLRHRDVCLYFSLVESTHEVARYETHRAGAPKPVALTYTIAQAKVAGLTGSSTWQKHPPAMLRARCAAALARAVYPDLVAGCYDPDEAREISGEYARPEPVAAPSLAVVETAAQTNPRDLAPLGVEAPAAPVAFATPGLSDAEMAAMLAMLAHCETVAALDATRAEIRPDVSTRATKAQRDALRAAAEKRRAWLETPRPSDDDPTPPRSGRKSARNDAATANDTAAEAAPAGEAASASRERIASAGGVRAYLSAKGSRREVEAAVRAHGRHVAGLAQIAAERLDALTQTDADGARPTRDTLLALALRWSAEGPLAEMRRAA